VFIDESFIPHWRTISESGGKKGNEEDCDQLCLERIQLQEEEREEADMRAS